MVVRHWGRVKGEMVEVPVMVGEIDYILEERRWGTFEATLMELVLDN